MENKNFLKTRIGRILKSALWGAAVALGIDLGDILAYHIWGSDYPSFFLGMYFALMGPYLHLKETLGYSLNTPDEGWWAVPLNMAIGAIVFASFALIYMLIKELWKLAVEERKLKN